ncbi:SDR family NAD(P)-dependent oxidoreductase [Aquamicrobium ahrensii]|uniref:NAD(P)-dependent dehydrogenase (Short-subunit alcohol dehydrogenase family) n=1 Tax=Aquamicrobium ahrensii TaxID=469551 RepID=A0ABV2KL25_9HYPH
MNESINGRHIVVTGGTGALGSVVVGMLTAQGAICHVPNTHAEPPANFPHAENPNVRLSHNIYLADAKTADAFYAEVPELWASIHLAGGFGAAPIEKTEPASFEELLETNVHTSFFCCRAAVRSMMAGGRGGRIVNVAAKPGLNPRRGSGMVAYTTSKAAVAAMTVSLAEEVKARNILVNAIAPSILDTPANRAAMPDADFGKWVSLATVAATISYLVAPANEAMSGALIPLYGQS